MYTLIEGVDARVDDQGEAEYRLTRELMLARGKALHGKTLVFTVGDGEKLWRAYLGKLPKKWRDHYNCAACRLFIIRYGPLVTVNENGSLCSLVFGAKPIINRTVRGTDMGRYVDAIDHMRQLVEDGTVESLAVPQGSAWGADNNYDPIRHVTWDHFRVCVPNYTPVVLDELNTEAKVLGDAKQNYELLTDAMQSQWGSREIGQMVARFQSGRLELKERHLPMLEWYQALVNNRRNPTRGNYREAVNARWLIASSAPAGWCHLRNTVVGQLLEFSRGQSEHAIENRWHKLVDSKTYQRPTTAPSEGNIDRAEKVVSKLGLEKSLQRRFARVEEVPAIWEASDPYPMHGGGVFNQLRRGESAHLTSGPVYITWHAFQRDIMPKAWKMEYIVPEGVSSYGAFTNAVHADSPPIYQWDKPDKRNPLAWFLLTGGSLPTLWGLGRPYNRVPITRICRGADAWGFTHFGGIVAFLLKGASFRGPAPGLGLFPEVLNSSTREIRKTVEAFSNAGKLEAVDNPACGVFLGQNIFARAITVTAYIDGISRDYAIDRWE